MPVPMKVQNCCGNKQMFKNDYRRYGLMETMHFTDKNGTFFLLQPENYSYLYFPVAGENGIKSALTPNLGGDIKTNQNAFLMEPVSAENLHNNRSGRNFWCHVEGVGAWSAVGASAEEESRKFTKNQDKSELTAGLMWQALTRQSEKYFSATAPVNPPPSALSRM